MRKDVKRDFRLKAFKCDIAGLELFVGDLLKQFADGNPTLYILMSYKNEDYKFNNIEDIKANVYGLPSYVTDIYINITDYEKHHRSCSISSGDWRAKIDAKADNEAWCAGVVEIAKSFSARNRVWYFFISAWHLWALGMLIALVPSIYSSITKKSLYVSLFNGLAFGSLLILSWVLFLAFGKVFPQFRLITQAPARWINRYATEIIVVGTVASALAAIINLLISKYERSG